MKPRIYTISVCGVFGLLLLLAAAPPKLSTYVGKFYGDGANLTNVAGGSGSQVWTNDGRRTYVLQSSDSVLVGTNSPGVLGTSSARGFSFALLTANGEPTEVVTNVTTTVGGLIRGATYYFTVTALGGGIESDYCNEVQVIIPKKPDKASGLTSP